MGNKRHCKPEERRNTALLSNRDYQASKMIKKLFEAPPKKVIRAERKLRKYYPRLYHVIAGYRNSHDFYALKLFEVKAVVHGYYFGGRWETLKPVLINFLNIDSERMEENE